MEWNENNGGGLDGWYVSTRQWSDDDGIMVKLVR
jgi:hypothetical protein